MGCATDFVCAGGTLRRTTSGDHDNSHGITALHG